MTKEEKIAAIERGMNRWKESCQKNLELPLVLLSRSNDGKISLRASGAVFSDLYLLSLLNDAINQVITNAPVENNINDDENEFPRT